MQKKQSIKELEQENATLRRIVSDTIWMARRYAHGRRTYAPTIVNEAVMDALKLGIYLEPDTYGFPDTTGNQMFVDDGILGKWNPEKKRFEKE